MRFLSRASFDPGLQMRTLETRAILLFLLFILGTACAGLHTFSDFPLSHDGQTDSGLVNANGLALGVDHWETVKLYGDASPTGTESSNYADVISSGRDTFLLFWIDNANQGVYKRSLVLTSSTGEFTGPSEKISQYSDYFFGYLHASGDKDNYLVSYVENGSSKLNLVLHNGNQTVALDSSGSSRYLFSSQCQMDTDTFLVIYSTNLNEIKLRKIYSDGTAIESIGTTVLASQPGLFNCSVAADSNGTILATWMSGEPNGAKTLHYLVLDRDLTPGPTGSIADIRDDNLTFYDDAPVVSYAPGWFAVSTHDASGVLLHRIDAQAQRTTERVVNTAGVTGSALAVNQHYLLMLCRGDVDGNGFSSIEGYRYTLNNEELISPEYYSVSEHTADVHVQDYYSTFINCALDDSGSVAAVWRHHDQVNAAALANRAVLNRRGFWTSSIQTVSLDPGDSVQFFRSEPEHGSLSSWYIEDSIRYGSGPGDFTGDGGWVSLKDSTALASARTTKNQFQYRVVIGRKTDPGMDSLSSVVLSRVDLPFNVQPVISSLDSVEINSRKVTGAAFNQERTLLSRSDTVDIFFTVKDQDQNETINVRVNPGNSNDTSFSLAQGPFFGAAVHVPPFPASDSTYRVHITAHDRHSWNARSESIFFYARNSSPRFSVKACRGISARDTLDLTDGESVVFQEDDSLVVFWSVSDSNDLATVAGKVHLNTGDELLGLDSCVSAQSRTFSLSGSLLKERLWTDLVFTGIDPDTSVSAGIRLRANHIPRIRTASFGEYSFSNGDSVRVNIGQETELSVDVEDLDLQIGDTLTYSLRTSSRHFTFNTTDQIFTTTVNPEIADSALFIRVSDLYGRSDSIAFFYKFPRYQPDTSHSSEYIKAADSISSGVSLVKGSRDTSVVTLPLENSGNDSMSIVSLTFLNQSSPWLAVRVEQGGDSAEYNSESSGMFEPVSMMPDSPLDLKFVFTADGLDGDGLAYDTVIIATTDPDYPFDTIPACLEYNDLPQIVNVGVSFDTSVPYEPLLKKRMAGGQYRFPPHAKLMIHFSEPMDSASAHQGLTVYSVLDSAQSGSTQPVGLSYEWSSDYSSLAVGADYQSASSRYGLKPPPGLFIPTDSLALVLTSALTDRANTPSGPNELDIKKNGSRSAAVLDTSFSYRVDSITFSLIDVSPDPGEQNLSSKPVVMLSFSSEVYARSVDTSRVDNKTLELTSLMGGTEQVDFDSVRIAGEKIWFYPSRRFYYGDEVKCRYRGVSVQNSMGFTADNSGDGISMPLFDPESTEDDVEWTFTVKQNQLLSVSPEEQTTLPGVGMNVILTFEEPLLPGTFDTDTSSANRSLTVMSRFGGSASSPFSSIEFSRDSTQITMVPAWKFFSSDTVTCEFSGFADTYSYTGENNLPSETATGSYTWTVYTGKTGFYTYPNPYRPNSDERHCELNGPCGIVFKNLHVIGKGTKEVRVRIFNMKSVPVYESEPVRLVPGASEYKPQWIWDTRNRAGREVSSGVYFYAICDSQNRVLLKGKLMIVR